MKTFLKHLLALALLTNSLLAACQPTLTPEPPLATATPHLPEYETMPGVYLGTFHGTSVSSVNLFERIGKGVAISGVYLNWSKGFNNGLLSANRYAGRVIQITWEFSPAQPSPLNTKAACWMPLPAAIMTNISTIGPTACANLAALFSCASDTK